EIELKQHGASSESVIGQYDSGRPVSRCSLLPPSRLAPGQFERNECIVISETPHQHSTPLGRWFLSIIRARPGRHQHFYGQLYGRCPRKKSRSTWCGVSDNSCFGETTLRQNSLH